MQGYQTRIWAAYGTNIYPTVEWAHIDIECPTFFVCTEMYVPPISIATPPTHKYEDYKNFETIPTKNFDPAAQILNCQRSWGIRSWAIRF